METLTLPSGRRLALHRLATGPARTLVFCHPAPGAGNFDPDPAETGRRPVSLLALDRPGYGGSDPVGPNEWSTVALAADDVAEALRHLNVDRVSVAGWSAGGRVALALAALHPALVERVVVIATPAPHEAVPWIPPPFQAALDALRPLPPAQVHAALGQQLAQMIPPEVDDDTLLGQIGRGPADDPALALPGARQRLTAMLRASIAQGPVGMAQDIAGYCLRPWGFEPSQVQAKTLLLYGNQDPAIGHRHGAWWQKQLPDARLEMVPNAGHLLVIPMWKRAMSFLAPGDLPHAR
jgi:pimeloyl-ACP methyl ester carboxylesterase